MSEVPLLYVVLLAMIAGFLALRLYSVLGKRTGHEQPLAPAEERVAAAPAPRVIDAAPEVRDARPKLADAAASDGLRQIAAAEPAFDPSRFVEGARAAYRMVLEAFWRGDRAALAELTTPDVLAAFEEAIAARQAAGETLENRLVAIDEATITSAAVLGRDARVTVRFDALIAAVTRDGDGNVVAGSTSDAVETHDDWTFARVLKSTDPHWKLSDTDEA